MSSLSDASSSSEESRGFEFNGTTYSTYSEMVAAKRQRNHNVLKRKLSEIAETVGSLKAKDVNTDASSSKRKKKIVTRKKPPVRRNPRRSSTSIASYNQNRDDGSSISSKSSSSFSNRSSDSDNYDTDDNLEEEFNGEKKKSHSISKKKKAGAHITNPPSVLRPRRSPQLSTASYSTDCSLGNVPSIYSTSRDILPKKIVERVMKSTSVISVNEPHPRDVYVPRPRPMADPSADKSEYLSLDLPNQYSRVRGPHADYLLPVEDVKDVSAVLEHIVLEGFRVKKRHETWRDFCAKNEAGGNDVLGEAESENIMEHKPNYAVDRRLYAGLFNSSSIASEKTSLCSESDDELIPKEYLLHYSDDCKPFGSSQEIDQQWIDEYGDGLDPSIFVDECMSSNTGEAGRYTTLLLQNCWDRAVSAVSSTVSVKLNKEKPFCAKRNEKDDEQSDSQCAKRKGTVPALSDQRLSVSSMLHAETMNIVNGIIDLLLSEKSGLMQALSGEESQNRAVTWKHVVRVLKDKVPSPETDTNDNPTEHVESSLTSLLDETVVKSITMRLLDRYEAAS